MDNLNCEFEQILGDSDLECIPSLPLYSYRNRDRVVPLWDVMSNHQSYFEFELHAWPITHDEDNAISENDFERSQMCHLCEVTVPVSYVEEHKSSPKHLANKSIGQISLERISKQMSLPSLAPLAPRPHTYYCFACSCAVPMSKQGQHKQSTRHKAAIRHDDMLNSLAQIFKDKNNASKVYKKQKDGDEGAERDGNTDGSNTNVDEDETTINKETHADLRGKNKIKEDTSDTESDNNNDVIITTKSGAMLKVDVDNYHGIYNAQTGLVCRVCRVVVGDKNCHIHEPEHDKKISVPILNKHCVRQVDSFWFHCILCNEIIEHLERHIKCSQHDANMETALIQVENLIQLSPELGAKESYENSDDEIDEDSDEIRTPLYHIMKTNKVFKCRICHIDVLKMEIEHHVRTKEHKDRYKALITKNGLKRLDDLTFFCEYCNVEVLEPKEITHVRRKTHRKSVKREGRLQNSNTQGTIAPFNKKHNKKEDTLKTTKEDERTETDSSDTSDASLEEMRPEYWKKTKGIVKFNEFMELKSEEVKNLAGDELHSLDTKMDGNEDKTQTEVNSVKQEPLSGSSSNYEISLEQQRDNLEDDSSSEDDNSYLENAEIVTKTKINKGSEDDSDSYESCSEVTSDNASETDKSYDFLEEELTDEETAEDEEFIDKTFNLFHETESGFKCKVCDCYVPKKIENILEHMDGVAHETKFKSFLADMSQEEKDRYSREVKETTSSQENAQKTYKIDKRQSVKHLFQLMKRIDDGKLYCDICNLDFQDKFVCVQEHVNSAIHMKNFMELLKENHIRQVISIYFCDVCKIYLRGKEVLDHIYSDAHVTIAHSFTVYEQIPTPKYECKVCNYTMVSNPIWIDVHNSGDAHLANLRKAEKAHAKNNVKCEVCDVYLTNNEHNLNTHNAGANHRENEKKFIKQQINNATDMKAVQNGMCAVCEVKVPDNPRNIEDHCKGMRHRENAAKVIAERKKETGKPAVLNENSETNTVPLTGTGDIEHNLNKKYIKAVNNGMHATCKVCDVTMLNNSLSLNGHVDTERHKELLLKFMKELVYKKCPATAADYSKGLEDASSYKRTYICHPCKVEVPNTPTNINAHNNGSRHKAAVLKEKQKYVSRYTSYPNPAIAKDHVVKTPASVHTTKSNRSLPTTPKRRPDFDKSSVRPSTNSVSRVEKFNEAAVASQDKNSDVTLKQTPENTGETSKDAKNIKVNAPTLNTEHKDDKTENLEAGSSKTEEQNDNNTDKYKGFYLCPLCKAVVPNNPIDIKNHMSTYRHRNKKKESKETPQTDSDKYVCEICKVHVGRNALDIKKHNDSTVHKMNFERILIKNKITIKDDKVCYCKPCDLYFNKQSVGTHVNRDSHLRQIELSKNSEDI